MQVMLDIWPLFAVVVERETEITDSGVLHLGVRDAASCLLG